ncbi:MAG: DUF364 domain-containing protein [Dehalococcoidales bacterium]|nr:DUF364 domain-containing protein [Dehalococcoidales bacterium]
MNILDDLIQSLNLDARVKDIRQGVFQTAVYTRGCGLASTPHEFSGHQHGISMVGSAGTLLDCDAEYLVNLSKSEREMEAAIGLATINSLLEVDKSLCRELNAADLIKQRGEGKNVAIIGHFPFIPQLQKTSGKLWVIEKKPHEGDFPEDEAENILPEADVIGITGVTLINHTFDRIVGLCRKDAFKVMLGGTTPLSPVLFDYGIDAVSGTLVTEPETVLNYVSQGATFRQIKGRKSLTMMK